MPSLSLAHHTAVGSLPALVHLTERDVVVTWFVALRSRAEPTELCHAATPPRRVSDVTWGLVAAPRARGIA